MFAFPKRYQSRLRTSNLNERIHHELKRQTRLVGPNNRSLWYFIAAVLMKADEDWQSAPCYLLITDNFTFLLWRYKAPYRFFLLLDVRATYVEDGYFLSFYGKSYTVATVHHLSDCAANSSSSGATGLSDFVGGFESELTGFHEE
jgi:hypothetical protein